jgi:hypothetical protein
LRDLQRLNERPELRDAYHAGQIGLLKKLS